MGAGLGRVRARRCTKGRGCSYLSNPNNPTGAVLSDDAMQRIVERCEQTGTWLLSDEVYLGAEIDAARGRQLLGHERRVIVDQRPVEGVRDSRRANRMDGRAAALIAVLDASTTT